MRPLIRSLFVFSVFGVIAVHISTGFLSNFASENAPLGVLFLDRMLFNYMIRPLGADFSVLLLYGIGTVAAIWTYMTGSRSTRATQRHSTW
jgi:hypothetical protein